MKFKTFKALMLATCAIYTIGTFFLEDHLLPWILTKDIPLWIEYFPLHRLIISALVILAVMYFLKSTISINNQSKMTKKAYCLYTGFFALIMTIPLLFFSARTEITTNAITTHNIIGQTSKVYNIEDAKKITVGLKASGTGGAKRMPKTHLTFIYEIEYEDGYSYTLENTDKEMWWTVVKGIDNIVTEKGIEKQVIGKTLYDMIYNFDNTYEFSDHLDSINTLMKE